MNDRANRQLTEALQELLQPQSAGGLIRISAALLTGKSQARSQLAAFANRVLGVEFSRSLRSADHMTV